MELSTRELISYSSRPLIAHYAVQRYNLTCTAFSSASGSLLQRGNSGLLDDNRESVWSAEQDAGHA
jgi:hypothetical protein